MLHLILPDLMYVLLILEQITSQRSYVMITHPQYTKAYDAKIALWECGAPEQPESREWFKIHIRKNTRPSEDMYVGEISCKDEDGLKQFVNDHEGTIFAEEDSQEMVMLCFRHSDMRISPEEWEKMSPSFNI